MFRKKFKKSGKLIIYQPRESASIWGFPCLRNYKATQKDALAPNRLLMLFPTCQVLAYFLNYATHNREIEYRRDPIRMGFFTPWKIRDVNKLNDAAYLIFHIMVTDFVQHIINANIYRNNGITTSENNMKRSKYTRSSQLRMH